MCIRDRGDTLYRVQVGAFAVRANAEKMLDLSLIHIFNAFGPNGGGNRGAGQAKAVIFFLVVAAISIIQL